MTCISGSVQDVIVSTASARDSIMELENQLVDSAADTKKAFYSLIDSHLQDAGIGDATEVEYNSAIKVEYTSEFSLAKIAGVVTSSLKALMISIALSAGYPVTTPAAIAAYVDVVNAVAEAAKSSSNAAASLSFSMNRLSKGMFAFLYARSVSINDVDVFGSEAVTSTAIYYRFMQSIDAIKVSAKYDAAIIDANNLLKMKTLQAALIDDVAEGKLSLEEWVKKDTLYSKVIDTIMKRLDAADFSRVQPFNLTADQGFGRVLVHSFDKGASADQVLVETSMRKLASMGSKYGIIIETSQKRLAETYF
ncbi:hypothetical protein D0S45_04715 [Marinifilum sp. JC120]|nr:hypothetical protein D0S45_04715 [Marinifilum sp. JC120]